MNITIPSKADIQTRLQPLNDYRSCGSRYLSEELQELAGQEFCMQGFALVLLVAAKNSFRRVYGQEKSMFSCEWFGLISNVVPKFVEALLPQADEAFLQDLGREMSEQRRAVTLT